MDKKIKELEIKMNNALKNGKMTNYYSLKQQIEKLICENKKKPFN